jgi:hypothetical protein
LLVILAISTIAINQLGCPNARNTLKRVDIASRNNLTLGIPNLCQHLRDSMSELGTLSKKAGKQKEKNGE